jgi:hypothetical protein
MNANNTERLSDTAYPESTLGSDVYHGILQLVRLLWLPTLLTPVIAPFLESVYAPHLLDLVGRAAPSVEPLLTPLSAALAFTFLVVWWREETTPG